MQSLSLAIITMVAAATTAGLILLLARVAPQIGLLDHPGGRKAHHAAIPMVGGLGMFAALMPFALISPESSAAPLAIALCLLVAVGFLDDRHELSPRVRFGAEVLAALIMVAHGDYANFLGNLFGWEAITLQGLAACAFTIICYVGVINASNMSDGLDGLAGGVSYIAIAWFTAIALISGHTGIALIGAATLGCLIGFLSFNLRTPWRPRASVFMGDAGSMALGFMLAWFAIELAGQKASLLTPIGAVWILAVPLLDMGSVMLYRMRSGRSPFSADRLHAHYILVDRGIPVGRVVTLQMVLGIVAGALGVTFPMLGIPEWAMFYAFLGLWFLTYRWIARAHRGPPAYDGRRSSNTFSAD